MTKTYQIYVRNLPGSNSDDKTWYPLTEEIATNLNKLSEFTTLFDINSVEYKTVPVSVIGD